jgi:hypothetical protein
MFQANCEGVTISNADFVYDSLDDLRNHVGAKVRNIEISGKKPNIDLIMMDSRGSVLRSVSEGGELTPEEMDKGTLLFGRATDLIMQRARFIMRIINTPVALVCSAGCFIGAYILNKYHPMPKDDIRYFVFAAIATGGIFLINNSAKTGFFRYISLESKTAKSSFWKRNRDDMIKMAIGSLIGAGSTLLIQFITRLLK